MVTELRPAFMTYDHCFAHLKLNKIWKQGEVRMIRIINKINHETFSADLEVELKKVSVATTVG